MRGLVGEGVMWGGRGRRGESVRVVRRGERGMMFSYQKRGSKNFMDKVCLDLRGAAFFPKAVARRCRHIFSFFF